MIKLRKAAETMQQLSRLVPGSFLRYAFHPLRRCRAMAARKAHILEAGGSSPPIATIFLSFVIGISQ